MKLYNQLLELEALKAICEGNKADSSILLGALDKNYFYTDCAKQAFERIQFLAKERTEIPSWSELITDPTLSENYREVLVNYNGPDNTASDKVYSAGLIKNLNNYRKAREMHAISERITSELTKESLDVDKVYQEMYESLLTAKAGKDISQCFTRIGYNSNVDEIIKGLLTGKSLRYIPTGFKGWDDVNGGLPRGKLGIIAATSGGGKSLCANQLSLNMSLQGAKVCIVPLEMSKEDMMHRFLANKTSLGMSDITKAEELTREDKRKAYKQFKEFEAKIAESGASIDLFHPTEDIEMEDLLFILKPYEYDVVIIDYIGLLKGVDGDDQWRKMGAAARFAKRWAETTKASVLILAQLSEDMLIRYSRAMKEHADLMWSWNSGKLSETDGHTIIKVEPQKGRNQAQQSFYLKVDYTKMSMVDASEEEKQYYEAKKKGQESQEKKYQSKEYKSTGSVDSDLYSGL